MNRRVGDAGQRAGSGMGRMGGSPVSGKMALFPGCVSCSMSLSLLCPPHCWENQPCSSQVPRIPPDSADLSIHRAEGPRPGHSEAAATGGGRHHHTECQSPSSRGPVHLGEGGERSGPVPGNLWALPSTPSPVSWGSHLSRSCSEWCGHTSGMPPPHSHP